MIPGETRCPTDPPSRDRFLGTPDETSKVVREGTHRQRSIADTLERATLAARRAGVTRLADITKLDHVGIPAFNSIRPGAAQGAITVTGGKGVTAEAAQVSALLEAVERFCGERNGRVGPVYTYEQARRLGRALDPRRLILDVRATYTLADELEWWPARELISGEEVLVPALAVLFPHEGGPFLFNPSTNGLASGNSLPEATLHALLEVMERDIVALGEATLEGPQLDLASIDDPTCARLVRQFQEAGLSLWIWAYRNAAGLPTFGVLIDDVERRDPMLINGGNGCHLDPTVALSRALTEAALSRATGISGAREDMAAKGQPLRELGYDKIKLEFPRFFSRDVPQVRLREMANLSTDSITSDLEAVVGAARKAGFREVLAVDLSVPGLEFPTARVIVPGAEFTQKAKQLKRVGKRLFQELQRGTQMLKKASLVPGT